jgi:MinD-like ATPase involved in chromosome partitioning or flagellar assembly
METRLFLLIGRDFPDADADLLRRILADGASLCQLRPVSNVPIALARIGGGGVDAVLLALSEVPGSVLVTEILDAVASLGRDAPQVPVVVLCDTDQPDIATRAREAGASALVARAQWRAELNGVIRDAIGDASPSSAPSLSTASETHGRASVTAILGAKGGVGTTTVALNVAVALAQGSQVILAEMRPTLGTLGLCFRPNRKVRNLRNLLDVLPGTLTPRAAELCLWQAPGTPGLSILLGPQNFEECQEIGAEQALAVLRALASLADYVIVDLPASLSAANRAILSGCDALALVVEREPVCMEAAKSILQAIEQFDVAPNSIGTVVVNRAALVSPVPLAELEAKLGFPTLVSIPPAADLCVRSQRARIPIVTLDAESMAAQQMDALARSLPQPRFRRPSMQPGTLASGPPHPPATLGAALFGAEAHANDGHRFLDATSPSTKSPPERGTLRARV